MISLEWGNLRFVMAGKNLKNCLAGYGFYLPLVMPVWTRSNWLYHYNGVMCILNQFLFIPQLMRTVLVQWLYFCNTLNLVPELTHLLDSQSTLNHKLSTRLQKNFLASCVNAAIESLSWSGGIRCVQITLRVASEVGQRIVCCLFWY